MEFNSTRSICFAHLHDTDRLGVQECTGCERPRDLDADLGAGEVAELPGLEDSSDDLCHCGFSRHVSLLISVMNCFVRVSFAVSFSKHLKQVYSLLKPL